MQREKILRRIGDSIGIIFNKEERAMYNLNVGDNVIISLEKKGDKE